MLKYSTVSAGIYSAKDITIYPETSVSVPPRLDTSGISNTCTVVYTVYSLYLYSQKCEQLLRFFLYSLYCLLFCFSIRDPARQLKFYAKEKKKDGSEYEPDSLRVMEASIDRYLRQMNYPDNIITGRPFKTSQETLNSKGKLL